MTLQGSETATVNRLEACLEAIQAEPPVFVVLEVDEGQERSMAVALLRRLALAHPVEEFTFTPDGLNIRSFLTAGPTQAADVVFLFGLAGLSAADRKGAWTSLNMARESIRTTRRRLVLCIALAHADEFFQYAPDLHACVTAHFRPPRPAQAPLFKDLLAARPLPEAQRLLRQANYYESAIKEPVIVPESRAALLRDYADLSEGMGDLARADVLRAKANELAAAPAEESPWLLQDYLQGLLRDTSAIRLSDLAVQIGQQILEIAIDEIYVPLCLLRAPARSTIELPALEHPQARDDLTPIADDELTQRMRLGLRTMAARQERKPEPIATEDLLRLGTVVILGDPGTGKSTFLRWLARAAAKALLGQLDTDIPSGVVASLGHRLPILIQAPRLAERLTTADQDPAAALAAAIPRSSGLAQLVEKRLRTGRCLVLVDGLDEIVSADARERTRGVLEGLARRQPRNAILVTSRIVGYDLVRLGTPFEQVTLTDLDDAGIQAFTRRWYQTISRASPAPADDLPERRAEILFTAIERHPGIHRIAGNPLLLTIIALIHWRGGRLPERRAAVYEAATRTLLDNWLIRRPVARLDVEEMTRVLSAIAFSMHESGETGLIPAQHLRQLFCEKLAELRFTSTDVVRGEVDHLLVTLSQHSGLFLERGLGEDGEPLYGFLHLTFQEYLAALHLFQCWMQWLTSAGGGRSRKAKATPIDPYLFKPRWQEVVLLAAGRTSETSDALAGTFVRGVASFTDQYESTLRRALLLTARVLADDVRVDKATAQDVCQAFVKLLTTSNIPSQQQAAMDIISQLNGTIYAGAIGDVLLARLQDADGDVRWAAAQALGALQDPRALEPLLARLQDADGDVRMAAAQALGALQDPHALEPLLARLQDADGDVRWAAARALEALQDPRALEPLLARLQDAKGFVRWAAAEALGALQDPRALEPLLARLQDAEGGVRMAAAQALGALQDPRALEPLLARLQDADGGVRQAAARALGALQDPRALEPLAAVALRRKPAQAPKAAQKPAPRSKPRRGVAEAREALFRLLYHGAIR